MSASSRGTGRVPPAPCPGGIPTRGVVEERRALGEKALLAWDSTHVVLPYPSLHTLHRWSPGGWPQLGPAVEGVLRGKPNRVFLRVASVQLDGGGPSSCGDWADWHGLEAPMSLGYSLGAGSAERCWLARFPARMLACVCPASMLVLFCPAWMLVSVWAPLSWVGSHASKHNPNVFLLIIQYI